ncbi:MAG: CaiB/BaiF CoA transferase family protein [Alphaproteobacteria bacterium]
MDQSVKSGPLSGYTVIELAGIGPGPYAGQLLSDMGADVIMVERPNGNFTGQGIPMIDRRGKKSIVIDLRKEGAAHVLLKLVKSADMLIEGNRPGVTERLGVGPDACHAVNPKLVYGRMTGWGQTGPWAPMAGHDINYISVTGALEAMGTNGQAPFPPLNLVGDYGGGSMFLIMGLLAALLKAEKTGQGDVVDAAIVDGTNSMMGIVHTLSGLGQWQTGRQSNLLDGAMPYYRCYKTSDDKFMAIGCIEPQFFAMMLAILKIDPAEFGGQNDPKCRADQHEKLEAAYQTKTRDEWAALFDGTDACVTPVLNYQEAAEHKHHAARGALVKDGLFHHPKTAPNFETSPCSVDYALAVKGADTRELLAAAGLSVNDIEAAIEAGFVMAAS